MSHALDDLWGAIIRHIDLDIVTQTLVISCRVEEGARLTYYELKLKNVSDFRFFNSIPGPWNYVDLTEIHSEEVPSKGIKVEMVLWSEKAGLVVSAGSIEVANVGELDLEGKLLLLGSARAAPRV